ncbi:hypothetical protein F0562_028503 [Nyssa sinensis]|uniref:HVA22-like protein n=1 Tax=Nyssa sinensis TaxID=561372 RepID=A0A5J5AY68_9ASTE|nr:hypothetical protein F0562_028503 [Nyssa sinensis]
MLGTFLSSALLMVFGYAYPAYECFKTVHRNEPETDRKDLLLWCQYWILVAMLTVCERVGDALISWLPSYGEAKLALFIYLWYPRRKGTVYIYNNFFRPYLANYETEIDRILLELWNGVGKFAVQIWQKAATYGQTTFFQILLYVSSQSASSSPPPAQVSSDKQE